MIEKKPVFSIIIPVYNREKEIYRAVMSCLAQSFKDIEIIIVDDGSTDQTVQVIKSIEDERVVLICHKVNQGVCPARNTAIDHSKGEWVVFLDSDDELKNDALEILRKKVSQCPDDIDHLGFLCQWDTGRILPEPIPEECTLDYAGYIRWNDTLILSDFFSCIRRRTFAKAKLAASRAYEDSYLFDFSLFYKIHMIPLVVVVKHTDSDNRITTMWGRDPITKLLENAEDQAQAMEYILERHGKALRLYGPRYFKIYNKSQILYNFLAGKRWKGSCLAVRYLAKYPASIDGWVILLAGFLGAKVLAQVKIKKAKWQNRQ